MPTRAYRTISTIYTIESCDDLLTKALVRLFIKQPEDTKNATVRYAYGQLAGFTCLACNLLLFTFKLLAGVLAGSLAVVADAFNNLSDAGSGVVTLFGFRLAHRPPDKDHPFGHGRVEYLSAMGVAVLIILAGVELVTSAVDKIRHPEPADVSWLTVIILVAAIAVKLWMALFCRHIGGRIRSEALLATGVDSRNDVICTGVVLAASLLGKYTGLMLDGYVGVAVALFVIWSGFSIIKETISPLMGQAPDPELVENIRRTVLSYEGIYGIHDMMVHDYGPGRVIVSLHAEVPVDADICQSHDIIDNIEQQLMRDYRIISCIHMDPIDTENPETVRLKQLALEVLAAIHEGLTLHDFRVVHGDSHTNLLFDVVAPFDYAGRDDLAAEIAHRLQAIDGKLHAIVQVEHDYT